MNARDTLRALANGETIIDKDGFLWRLDEYDELVLRKPERERWARSYLIFNSNCEIYNEFPLTFEQALREMLDGKVVMCKEPFHGYAYRFHNGRFEDSHVNDCFTKWEECGMPSFRQNSKWKVVE